jgi:hypothetical protein
MATEKKVLLGFSTKRFRKFFISVMSLYVTVPGLPLVSQHRGNDLYEKTNGLVSSNLPNRQVVHWSESDGSIETGTSVFWWHYEKNWCGQ